MHEGSERRRQCRCARRGQSRRSNGSSRTDTLNISITSIPSGHYRQADGSFAPMTDSMLQLAPPEPEPQPEPAPKLQLDEPPIEPGFSPDPVSRPERDDDHGVVYLKRAQEMGYKPLPPRQPRADW